MPQRGLRSLVRKSEISTVAPDSGFINAVHRTSGRWPLAFSVALGPKKGSSFSIQGRLAALQFASAHTEQRTLTSLTLEVFWDICFPRFADVQLGKGPSQTQAGLALS